MGRDYTKYNVSGLGENLNKRQLVFEIVKDYVEKKKPSFDELTAVFKDEIQGSKGFIKKAAKVKDAKRFNTKTPLKIKFGVEVVVSNQWGKDNLAVFIDHVKGLGYKVESVSGEVSTDQNPASGTASEVTKTPEISDEIKALINEAAPYEMDEILSQILGREDHEIECIDFLPYLKEILKNGSFCGAALSESYFGEAEQIEFCNDTMRDIITEADDESDGYGTVKEYQAVWSDLLKLASESVDSENFETHMHIAKCIDEDICPFENLDEMHALADKHFKIASEIADSFEEIHEVITYCVDAENYSNNTLAEVCIKRGLKMADSFRHFSRLCFRGDVQIAKGEDFTTALNECKKCLAAKDFDPEFYSIEISALNNSLANKGMDKLQIPEYNIDSLMKMKLPEQLTPEWDTNWGSFVTIRLLNSPDLETDGFHISLSLGTGHILGQDKERTSSNPDYNWFNDEALLYQYNLEEYASSANIKIFDSSNMLVCEAIWHSAFEDCDEGELPEGLSEDKFNEIFNGKWFSALYHHIKQNITHDGMDN